MNEVFLIGKVVSDVELKFIINSKKNKSIGKFNLETDKKQIIDITAYNEIADFVYRKIAKGQHVFIYGMLYINEVIVKEIKIL